MKSLSCRDAGVDCDWKTTGETDEEIMQKAQKHAREDHGMMEIPKEMADKAKAAIKEMKEKAA